MTRLSLLLAIAVLGGCSPTPPPAPKTTPAQSSHAEHEGHGMAHTDTLAAVIVADSGWENLQVAKPAKLKFHLEVSKKKVAAFDVLHEKEMHFIVVRDALDEFQHLHPTVNADGTAEVELTLAKAGVFHIYIDYKALDLPANTAKKTITVKGKPAASPALQINAPGQVMADDLAVDIKISSSSANQPQTISFQLKDRQTGMPVEDLEQYLGAMGHLVVIRAATKDYIHAHPEAASKSANEVTFMVHTPGAGTYAGWAQFQRAGVIKTVPFVFDVK